jgi:hypothetical protein
MLRAATVDRSITIDEKQEWLRDHIPHRVRACLAITCMLTDYLDIDCGRLVPAVKDEDSNYQIIRRCETDCIWEGRLVALRWLIEFVGVKADKDGKPERCTPRVDDLWIEDIDCNGAFDLQLPESQLLADFWCIATKASAHSTWKSQHPSASDERRNRAATLLIDHLGRTIYRDEPNWIKKYILKV